MVFSPHSLTSLLFSASLSNHIAETLQIYLPILLVDQTSYSLSVPSSAMFSEPYLWMFFVCLVGFVLFCFVIPLRLGSTTLCFDSLWFSVIVSVYFKEKYF